MADRPVTRVCWQLAPRTFAVASDRDVSVTYTVYLGYANGQAPTCTCLGFGMVKPDEFGIKRCKHVRRVELDRCTWTEALDGEVEPRKWYRGARSERCPRCGGHTVEVLLQGGTGL